MFKEFMNFLKATGSIKEARGLVKQIGTLEKEEQPFAVEKVKNFLKLKVKNIKVKQVEKDVVEFSGDTSKTELNVVADRAKNEMVKTETVSSKDFTSPFAPHLKQTTITKSDLQGNVKLKKHRTEYSSSSEENSAEHITTILENAVTGSVYKQVKFYGKTNYFKYGSDGCVPLFKK